MYTTGVRIIIAFASFVAGKCHSAGNLHSASGWVLASTEIDPPRARKYHAILKY